MVDCSTELKRMVPLRKVVSAAMVDSYEDIGKAEQRFSHWGARGLKKFDRETLKTAFRNALLRVNRNTNSATLPLDFSEEINVFFYDEARGVKIPLRRHTNLIDIKNLADIECVDRCPKCNQDKAICAEMTVTEETTMVQVGSGLEEQTIVKRLYPNGDYYLESRIPMWDYGTSSVIFRTQKDFITHIDLKPCGCLDDTEQTITKLQCICPDIYCQYYAPCDKNCNPDYGGYRIFPETGIIQFDNIGTFKKAYIEYWGFMPRVNGQYMVPEVAFETLVNYIKFKAVENKRNIPLWERTWTEGQYKKERSNMEKILGRISLSQIIDASELIPKFDIYIPRLLDCVSTVVSTPTATTVQEECSPTGQPVCPPSTTVTTGGGTGSLYNLFSISAVAGNGSGHPTPGINTYQNNKLIGALGVDMIIVNNSNETIAGGNFSLDTVTGILTRIGNVWQTGDVLVVPTFFKLV